MKTEEFNLSEETLARLGRHDIITATPIQKKIIPAIMKGRDVLAQSETGSGKTLSFAVPIIETTNYKSGITSLILVPTRELCTQITGEFVKFAGRKIGICPVYGGVSIDNQIRKLKRSQIVVATPGRLLDIINRRAIKLDGVKYFVLDEADRMLDMGFISDIEKIMKHIPEKRQTLLFSATITKEISGLIKKYLNDPVKVSLESTVKPEFLKQTYYKTTKKQKLPLLINLLKKERDLALIFCNRKRITEELAKELSREGVKAACLNGDMSQAQRERVTRQFKEKRYSVLIATDVASRGLHIEDISHVYNYEIPRDVESYTHRIGRTARAGKKGEAISFVTGGDDERFFKQILFTYKGIITLKYADSIKESKDKTTAETGKYTETKPKREPKKLDEKPHYEERRSGDRKKEDRREDDRRKDDRRKDDRRKDDRRKDD
ncbi:MAG: DEAD/DEAH box helicase, partial [Bacteroidetes bacterium]|nr:DEAD/DEAH box helicase [Bacteroidota bacterium]